MAPNPVYTSFPDKASVQSDLVERVLGQVADGATPDRNQPWREQVASLVPRVKSRLAAHPDVLPLAITGPLDGPNARARTARLLSAYRLSSSTTPEQTGHGTIAVDSRARRRAAPQPDG
jgi:TetR/AcrR family transcriptional regulator, tetracycline repressor protein